jgi:hypothetical protein
MHLLVRCNQSPEAASHHSISDDLSNFHIDDKTGLD